MGREKIRLFCVPYAGGNSYSYRDWQKHTAEFVDVVPIELPGRGRRSSEALLVGMDALVEDVFAQIRPLMPEPYAIFGHSMGACLGYLLTRRILDAGLCPPVHLFCSGRDAPSLGSNHRDRHLLPRALFIEVLREMGGCPEEILNDDELMDYFVPVLRADFQAHASYLYQQPYVFDIPLTVMMGLEDAETTCSGVLEWQRETSREINIVQFSGGHFFIFDHLPEIGRNISSQFD